MAREAINNLLTLWGVQKTSDRNLIIDAIHFYIYPEAPVGTRQPKAGDIYRQLSEYGGESEEWIERRVMRVIHQIKKSRHQTAADLFETEEVKLIPFLAAFYERYIMPGDLVRALWKVVDKLNKQKKRTAN